MNRIAAIATAAAIVSGLAAGPAAAEEAKKATFPVLVPITGFLALEGTAQRNGAVLALDEGAEGVSVAYEVQDTGTSPEVAVNALLRALSRDEVSAVAASIFGTQMLAMMPVAAEAGVPLLTVSGTAKLTELDNPWVFRFFPTDAVVKVAQARYIVEELSRKRPAILYQTTAYGQSGRGHLVAAFEKLGAEVVYEEGLAPDVRDMLPALSKALAANPDVLVLHLHSGPTALFVRQAKANGTDLPIVAGSAMHQPTTAALLEPAELAGVCAESGSSPVSVGSPEMDAFAQAYRARFDAEPDAFALGQYDAMRMALSAIADGAATPKALRDKLASMVYEGLAMTYKSDGTGNMAHDAVIVCYDGESRIPRIAARYENVDGAR
ncbi:MAG: ABC transporter substrate-binding protein [Rhodospirillaceae bacterium]|jgi:branched-chain amino acid transport system substrate-binding protein|nr:ABC transporter substrate-binding protein [Rhodospirillaceae bacterium]MBT6116711.1 ABC transporter substrate-binding protein [Rhodospirillaceae bacterium]